MADQYNQPPAKRQRFDELDLTTNEPSPSSSCLPIGNPSPVKKPSPPMPAPIPAETRNSPAEFDLDMLKAIIGEDISYKDLSQLRDVSGGNTERGE